MPASTANTASDEWLTDERGNRCSIAYFGSREAAQEALDSLSNCHNCVNCSDCLGCSGCSDCSRCSGCSDCSYCYGCSDCSRCSDCLGCSGCLGRSRGAEVPSVPVIPDIHRTIYAAASQPHALEMGNWHTCENTHCRAGWTVALAGEQGRALERFFNTELAAMMIYDASDPTYKINPARFYDSNDEALEDMRRLAEAEA